MRDQGHTRPLGGLFRGTDETISSFLELRPKETLKQKRTNRALNSRPRTSLNFSVLVSTLYDQITANRSGRRPSDENWRITRQIYISPGNCSPEVMLERAIANMGERGVLGEWFNQVPVASGLVNATADKRAAVDLMRFNGRTVELVELKWKSDQPAFAAFEILRYGLAFLYSYVNQDALGYQDNPLMQVRGADLRVLAPHEYYDGLDLTWLSAGLDAGIRKVAEDLTSGALSMSFGFRTFPRGFELPFESGEDVLRLRTEDTDAGRTLETAMRSIEPVWDDGRVQGLGDGG